MKHLIKSLAIAWLLSISVSAFSQTTLTQAQVKQLKTDQDFKDYLVYKVLSDDVGGVGYLLRLTTMSDQQAPWFIFAKQVRSNPNLVENDGILVQFILQQMNVRDIDKKNAGSDLVADVIAYLNESNRINLLVQDYLTEKTRGM